MTGLFRWPLSQSVFLSLHELVTLALPVLPTRQPLSNLSPAGFSYRNGGLGAGVFPEALLQPGTWAGGRVGRFRAQELFLPLTSFLLQGSLGPLALGTVSQTEGTEFRG